MVRTRCTLVCGVLLAAVFAACGVKGPPRPPLKAVPPPVAGLEAISREHAVVLSWPAVRTTSEDTQKNVKGREPVRDTWGRPLPPKLPRTDPAQYSIMRRQLDERGMGLTRNEEIARVPATNDASQRRVTYTDTDVVDGAIYEYAVRTLDARERRSERAAKTRTRWVSPPGAPQALEADEGDGYIALSWEPPPAAGTQPPSTVHALRYIVYRQRVGKDTEVAPPAAFQRVSPKPIPKDIDDTTDDTTWTDREVKNGVLYRYHVRALKPLPPPAGAYAGVEGPPSDAVIASPRDTLAPPPPWGLAVTERAGGGATVRWGGSNAEDVVSFHVYRRAAGGRRVRIASVSAAQKSYVDKSLGIGIRYEYVVTAVDEAGNESRASDPWSIKLLP